MPPIAGGTPTRRKRQLSLVAQEAAAEPNQPVSSAKKRRLNEAGSSTVASTGAAAAAAAISKSGNIVGGALSDAWNFGRRIASGRASSAAQKGESVQSTYEVPDSDDEAKAKKPDTKTASNAAAQPASAGRTRAAQRHVYDVPDSDTEQDPAALTPQPGRRKDTAPLSRPRLEEDSGRRTSGRQRKPTAKLSEALAKSVPEPDAEQEEAETPSKRRTRRHPGDTARPNSRISSEIGELFPPEALHDPSLVSSKLVPRKRKTPAGKQREAIPKTSANVTPVGNRAARKPREPPTTGKSAEVVFDDLPSGRAKRVAKPSRRAAEMVDASPAKTKPAKQISRTAKNGVDKRMGRREQEEDVQVEESEIEEAGEIHAAAEEPEQQGDAGEDEEVEEVEEDEEPEDEDDEVCTICSKPDSKASNKILFCDSCDMAVHQKCYGIMFIPKGDWFCRSCAPEEQDQAEGSAPDQDAPLANDQPPGIANFDQHLGSMQRVLLDRCTGRRRIRLRGQDEAYEKTTQVIEQTIVAGEGNSMLIIGARGSGKTTVSVLLSARSGRMMLANSKSSWSNRF